jgi:hypothetical protein
MGLSLKDEGVNHSEPKGQTKGTVERLEIGDERTEGCVNNRHHSYGQKSQ